MFRYLILSLITCVVCHSQADETRSNKFTSLKEALKTKIKLNQKATAQALEFLKNNMNKENLSSEYLAIADFTQASSKKRLAIIHLPTNKVEYYKVAHGKGSDKNHDLKFDKFDSTPGSNATPEGFHKMTTTYIGKHGLSLRMKGLESKNHNSTKRAIVLHGADYVSWKYTGRSQGCPAVERQYAKKIISQLKNGSLFYHYNGQP